MTDEELLEALERAPRGEQRHFLAIALRGRVAATPAAWTSRLKRILALVPASYDVDFTRYPDPLDDVDKASSSISRLLRRTSRGGVVDSSPGATRALEIANSMTILVLERDAALARGLARMFRHEAVTVSPDAIAADGYDLVLGSRPELLAAIRARPASPLCVLLVDAEAITPATSFDACVVKPPTWRALCEAIEVARRTRVS
jgi:hypothetical protein